MRLNVLPFLACAALFAGCAAPQPVAQQQTAQGAAYMAKVIAVRPVSGGLALAQVMQVLGQPGAGTAAPAREVVVQLADGSVKTLVPPPSAAMAALTPGTPVVITETPELRVVAR